MYTKSPVVIVIITHIIVLYYYYQVTRSILIAKFQDIESSSFKTFPEKSSAVMTVAFSLTQIPN